MAFPAGKARMTALQASPLAAAARLLAPAALPQDPGAVELRAEIEAFFAELGEAVLARDGGWPPWSCPRICATSGA